MKKSIREMAMRAKLRSSYTHHIDQTATANQYVYMMVWIF